MSTLRTGSAVCAWVAAVGGLWLAWRSCAFWHGGGALWTALTTGGFVAAAAYLRRRRVYPALFVGVAAGLAAGIGVAFVAIARCSS
jgi:hypothetical protein